jgi:DNA-binding CsgD family transcriptional regulator
MQPEPLPENAAPTCIRTLRLKVKSESYPWLNAAATEINQVWNYANEISAKAARPFAGPPKWLSAYDLDKLTAGATDYFEHIGSDTIQRVNHEFATRRKQFKKARLRWRVSRGAKRSLGWIPYKAVQLKRQGKSLRFCGKSIRVFEKQLLDDKTWKSGCFAQDSVGDWWLCLPVTYEVMDSVAPNEDVGIDLGLKDTAATSDGEKLEAGHFYRGIEQRIAQAQRRGHRRQAKEYPVRREVLPVRLRERALVVSSAAEPGISPARGKAQRTDGGGMNTGVLTDRETAVLARIRLGESNKEVARSLGVSPSTVGTHVESIFRKLECSTRAAATLKAYTLGII